MWGLADCNNFFVSCERSVDSSLKNRAVVVLSNNDGCAIARSNEAKRLGVKMGQPAFELRDMIRSGQLLALSGNHLLYRRISLQVHDIMRRFVPATLDYSVDEAFLDVTGVPFDALANIGQSIVDTCLTEADIPVTVGFAPTKTLAKVATELGKKNDQRVWIMNDTDEINSALENISVGDIWGIGRRLARRLYDEGIYNAFQLSKCELTWIRGNFGVNGEKLWRELNGEPCIELNHVGRQLQDSISETRTFPRDESDFDYIRSRIVIYAADCARRLRGMQGRCLSVSVMLRTNRFHSEEGYEAPTATIFFPSPVCDTNVIVDGALAALERIFNPRKRYKRAGVILNDITAADTYTPSLFAEQDAEQLIKSKCHPNLMKTIDNINREIGVPQIRLASQLVNGQPGHNDGYSSSFGAPGRNR